MAAELGAGRVVIFSDSKLVTQQVTGGYEAKDEKTASSGAAGKVQFL